MVKTYIWDVPSPCLVSYSGSPPAAEAMGTKSTGGFNHPEGYPVSGIINNLGCRACTRGSACIKGSAGTTFLQLD